jgi:hypothetical protein
LLHGSPFSFPEGSGTAHIPSRPGTSQRSNDATQRRSQQKPSKQISDSHCSSFEQGTPLGRRVRVGVTVMLGVRVGVPVAVRLLVAVAVAVSVGVEVEVAVGVLVGV